MKKFVKIDIFMVIMFLFAVYMAIAMLGKYNKGIDGAEDAANRYCEMVYDGNWPDYQQNYDKFCDGPKWNGK